MSCLLNITDGPPPAICIRCARNKQSKGSCGCQTCHDGYHQCKYRLRTIHVKDLRVEDTTTYTDGAVENRKCPPRRLPAHRCDEMESKTLYMLEYRPPGQMITKEIMDKLAFKKGSQIDWDTPVTKPDPPVHPPRPYDYSKNEGHDKRGVLYLPQDMIHAHKLMSEQLEKPEVKLPCYHSDGAPTYYPGTSTAKDSYDAGINLYEKACCRPEAHYHPEQLRTCIACHDSNNKKHPMKCQLMLYDKPERATRHTPYMGLTPAMRDCSVYENAYKDPSKFLIPEPPCVRPCRPPIHCPAFSHNLQLCPIPVGYTRCDQQ